MKRTDLGLSIPKDRMLTTEDVGKILGISARHVRIKALRGVLPRHVIDRRVLFAPKDVEAYIRRHREEA